MSVISRVYTALINGLATLGGLIIAGVCLLIVYDVVARNIGLQPPSSTVALTEYALLYFTMLAAPWLVRVRGHIVVEIIHGRLTGTAKKIVDKLILAVCIVVAVFICVLATALALEAWQLGEVEIRSLNMPRWLLFSPLALGFGLMGTEFLRLLVRGETVADGTAQREAL
ncbi:MAG: TRAP transporter small permease subunit [Gammaproteobacteria bacterium]|jgi:TRAP-type C4-dicarboxylate transport system permease small subunit|nr:TRAP transporter small permease subunit [Gammaproteobacteria bacterium]MDP6617553.1 TRAP transporter small permease subunit [Gammaproteobacteria bacterium]MDP6694430.1 TRAP transporter small permease subunit [Gammaproteobacteria bacterium]MDP7042248.1 TRAP transporter small permease subunit [Gammaproteobacteria bacterium]